MAQSTVRYDILVIPSGKEYKNSPAGTVYLYYSTKFDIRYYAEPWQEPPEQPVVPVPSLDRPVYVGYIICMPTADVVKMIMPNGKIPQEYKVVSMTAIYKRGFVPGSSDLQFTLISNNLQEIALTPATKKKLLADPERYGWAFKEVTVKVNWC